MDPNTGVLRTRVPLDRESRDKYILQIEARNEHSVGYCQVSLSLYFIYNKKKKNKQKIKFFSLLKIYMTHRICAHIYIYVYEVVRSIPICDAFIVCDE